MEYIVIKKHTSNYPNPLCVIKGEKVKVGRRYTGNKDWANWIYCVKLDKSQEGWVPEQIIAISEHLGTLLEDYTAKELTINKGEKVIGAQELNGWIWCEGSSINSGWIPKSNLKIVS